jgi:type I restriction enzyme M protein
LLLETENCFMMNEFDAHSMSPVETVKRQIWLIFDQLRKDGLGLDESHMILLFLSLYKDGMIEKDFIFNTNVHYQNNTDDLLNKPTDKPSIEYQEIIQIFSYSISKLHGIGFNRLIDSLLEINRETLSENFQEIFESILFRISKSLGRYGGEFIQPVELTRLISVLADLPKNAKIFNPFAGLASFGVYIDQYQYYSGQELNPKTWAIGALRIMAFGKQGNTNYVCEDSILNWPDVSQKFDLIVSTPPFGMRLGGIYRAVAPGIVSVEQFLIEKSLKSLNQNGKLIALLPQGFLFRGNIEQQFRKMLIDEDVIDSIISLPAGLLFNSGIPLVVIIISKNKKLLGKVKFIQAEKYFIAASPKEKVFDFNAFKKLLDSRMHNEEEIRIADNQKIRALNYNLNVPRYFQEDIEGVRLGEFLVPLSGQRSNLPIIGKLVRISNLKDDKLDFQWNLSNIENSE